MNIFSQLTAGDSATWNDSAFTDTQGTTYDSGSYALRYEIRGPGGPLTLNATPLGKGWQTTITTAQSALTPGKYYWTAFASKTGVRVTAGTGTFTMLADLTGAGAAFDGSSQAEKDLLAVRAEISARAGNGMTVEYTIGSRSLKREPVTALLALESKLIRQVNAERAIERQANGLGNPRRISVRFTNPGGN